MVESTSTSKGYKTLLAGSSPYLKNALVGDSGGRGSEMAVLPPRFHENHMMLAGLGSSGYTIRALIPPAQGCHEDRT